MCRRRLRDGEDATAKRRTKTTGSLRFPLRLLGIICLLYSSVVGLAVIFLLVLLGLVWAGMSFPDVLTPDDKRQLFGVVAFCLFLFLGTVLHLVGGLDLAGLRRRGRSLVMLSSIMLVAVAGVLMTCVLADMAGMTESRDIRLAETIVCLLLPVLIWPCIAFVWAWSE